MPPRERSDTATRAPSRAIATAVARPIPDAPPVTNATLPSRMPAMMISSCFYCLHANELRLLKESQSRANSAYHGGAGRRLQPHLPVLAARVVPEFAHSMFPRKKRAQGIPGALPAPIASCAE